LYSLTSWWVRLAFSLPQHEIVTVTTNVPGPQQPLYAMGRRLVEIIPYVPIATTLRTGIAIFSYCGTVTFGITGDFSATPDLEVLADGIESGLSELLAAARCHQQASVTS
jgi:diacylglycerol O-acyltransferase